MSKKIDELSLNYAKEVLGGMKRIEIDVEEDIVNEIVKLFPNVKIDKSTTDSIELLPKSFKNEILKLIIEKKIDPKKALLEVLNTLKYR